MWTLLIWCLFSHAQTSRKSGFHFGFWFLFCFDLIKITAVIKTVTETLAVFLVFDDGVTMLMIALSVCSVKLGLYFWRKTTI